MLPLVVPVVPSPPPLDPRSSSASWPTTAAITLRWNVAHARPATDPTVVHVATDGKALYVRFDASQHEPVIATQHSDDLVTGGSNINQGIAWSDDAVWVDLWPTGAGGFSYQFEANPNGSHNEASSENTDFAPQWESHGEATSDGYTVTMAIPLTVLHGAHVGTWRMQFIRYVRTTGALNVWSYDPVQTNPDDVARAGDVTLPTVARPPLPKPRAALYTLGAVSSRRAGGDTSRLGADFSFPVTQTASVYGTVHPDYSDVELDQQSIQPIVYHRPFNEVRPFFTQASGFYGDFNCDVCNGFRTTLYTPAIPTPRSGYAFEGREGLYGLAAFDSIGVDRTDVASALNYSSPDTHWFGAVQHVSANLPRLTDDSNQAGMSWYNGKYLSAYANYAWETGTNVPDRSQGDWIDAGGGWGNQDYNLFGSVRKVGSEFNPVDGFDSHPGVAGYGLFSARVWTFAPRDFLSTAGIALFGDRYQGVTQGQAQSDNALIADFLTKNTWDVQLTSGSNYWRFGDVLTPISQNGGISITYHSGMQNNMNNFPQHGSSATPTTLQWYSGRYGDGRLDTWIRSSTVRVGTRGSLTFTLDDTAQWMPPGQPDNVQWFDGLAYGYQVNARSSFAVGLRRVIGFPPQPNGGGNCEGTCSNVSVAYHVRLNHEEIYAAYGNPNSLVTVPQALLKVIFYVGGQKGT